MKKLLLLLVLGLSLHANDIIIKESALDVNQSVEKLKTVLIDKGFTVFAIIDHHQNAAEVNMPLPEAKVILFGNPKGGTVLMQEDIVAGLDLPLRVLVYQDNDSKIKVAYRNGTWLKEHYALKNDALIGKIDGGLEMMITEAIK
jgi:uncharacterized protein (DUF302 family)